MPGYLKAYFYQNKMLWFVSTSEYQRYVCCRSHAVPPVSDWPLAILRPGGIITSCAHFQTPDVHQFSKRNSMWQGNLALHQTLLLLSSGEMTNFYWQKENWNKSFPIWSFTLLQEYANQSLLKIKWKVMRKLEELHVLYSKPGCERISWNTKF